MREIDILEELTPIDILENDSPMLKGTEIFSVPKAREPVSPFESGVLLPKGLPLETAVVFIDSAQALFDLSEFDFHQQLFLAMYIRYGNKTSACLASATDPRIVRNWEGTKHFAEISYSIRECIADALESEAYKRAMDGSDRLLEVALKAAKPEKYADKKMIAKKTDITINSWAELAKKVAEETNEEIEDDTQQAM
jgi:hypothetical protein